MTKNPGFTEITRCRFSGSENLVTVVDLGTQMLTGVFPKDKAQEHVTSGPVQLVLCPDSGLLQMKQTYNLSEMYGMNYGYRSGLNRSMVEHLKSTANYLKSKVSLEPRDVVLDIGSNDGTLLGFFDKLGVSRMGIDPTSKKFSQYYQPDIKIVPDFFSFEVFDQHAKGAKAKLITSLSMLYDLEDPAAFVRDVRASIDEKNGLWHFEQSYLPSMLRANSYDTICHEHIEYYSLGVIKRMLDSADLRIISVQMNGINGGSIAVTACAKSADYKSDDALIDWFLEEEEVMALGTPKPYLEFSERMASHRTSLRNLIDSLNNAGKKVAAYGASTKGNVLLQYCGFTDSDIACVSEVNPDKFGCFTPGSRMPILSEDEVKKMKPDYMLVLPWHFRTNILQREAEYLNAGGRFIFPFPYIEII